MVVVSSGDEHYNCISALHKSIRGSDDNAAMYWLARMIEGGEDALFVARRLIVCASEDIGVSVGFLWLATGLFREKTCCQFLWPKNRISIPNQKAVTGSH